jgi:hypothetical protein
MINPLVSLFILLMVGCITGYVIFEVYLYLANKK